MLALHCHRHFTPTCPALTSRPHPGFALHPPVENPLPLQALVSPLPFSATPLDLWFGLNQVKLDNNLPPAALAVLLALVF